MIIVLIKEEKTYQKNIKNSKEKKFYLKTETNLALNFVLIALMYLKKTYQKNINYSNEKKFYLKTESNLALNFVLIAFCVNFFLLNFAFSRQSQIVCL